MRRAWWLAGLTALLAGTAGPGMADEESAALVGKDAPEISTREWINSDGRTTIADYKGEVLLLEEFATW